MDNVRRVMEGVSIREVVAGDPYEVKKNLENLAARCTGAMAALPGPSATKDLNRGKPQETVRTPTVGRKLPVITDMTVVKEATRGKATRKRTTSDTKTGPAGRSGPIAEPSTRSRAMASTARGKMSGGLSATQPLPQKQSKKTPQPDKEDTPWTEVVKRGGKGKGPKSASQPAPVASGSKQMPKTGPAVRGEAKGETRVNAPARNDKKKRRAPRTAAVSLTFPKGMYEEGIRGIRSKIKLEDINIEELRPRRGLTGALILEIPGENAQEKADTLVQKIREVVGDAEGVRVARPVKTAELRIKNLDESITQDEIRDAVARAGQCSSQDIKLGPIRVAANGLGTVWAQCPLVAAKRVAEPGRIRVGWVAARVELLEARPLVCFRCLERGHVRAQCKSKEDRTNVCYRCGEEGHESAGCSAKPRCAVCKDRGLPDSHKAGGAACPPKSKRAAKKERREARQQPATQTQGPRSHKADQAEAAAVNLIDRSMDVEVEDGKTESLDWDHLDTPAGLMGGNRAHGTQSQADLAVRIEAQDLFLHTLAERGCGIGVIAEPYNVPKNPNWAGSLDGSVAITWRRTGQRQVPWSKVSEGEGWILVDCDTILIMGVYLRPSLTRMELEDRLDRMERELRSFLPRPILVAGDFNAKSADWGSRRPDVKGAEVVAWAARLGLKLENRGSASTCVRPQGESIVDLTWTSPAAANWVENWRVMEEAETLSDHLLIEMTLVRPTARGRMDSGTNSRIRWAVGKLDQDMLLATLKAATWPQGEPQRDVEREAKWLRETLTRACDSSMPRARFTPRRYAFWWSDAIAELRQASIRHRRTLQRERKKPIARERLETLLTNYRESRIALKQAIRKAKETAWAELIDALDEDPWGRPYKLILKRLSSGAPPTVESLRVDFLDQVVNTLFPAGGRGGTVQDGGDEPVEEGTPQEWDESMAVSREEISRAAKKLKARKAPGPDGVPGTVWRIALGELADRVSALYTACLRERKFPEIWKDSSLVLLRKEGKPEDAPNGYRPICLLDEVGKTLERVIAARLARHMDNSGRCLSERQFGFREGKSTIDAIKYVKSLSDLVIEGGGVVTAVAIDIANAFNSLPHEVINRALTRFGFPGPLAGTVRDYLKGRWITCTDRGGDRRSWAAGCGVPQGSVLGPLLWDIAYDEVLDAALPAGSTLVCYADDTLVLAGGDDWARAAEKANLAVACAIRAIRALGLEVAAKKTEAVYLHDGSHGNRAPGVYKHRGDAHPGRRKYPVPGTPD
ncbi:PREDICTED: uncharacterized protein LOC105556455 [Vollenhovia emeryi]|uniref:uncharacterized protein LOC105556455 n=1 Tax=Vollenhovia emeryi TaxID=411798 RepID=UPI0005F4FE91|nr:PREDICTED: uncharacterized protein LOC105556455 [Vollenhovia emeryi]